jgi:para-nitrobenzyl esterase
MKQIFPYLLILAQFTTGCTARQHPGPIEAGEHIAVVSTEYGDVRGHIDDGVFAFKGIPYAKADRFMPPEPPDP